VSAEFNSQCQTASSVIKIHQRFLTSVVIIIENDHCVDIYGFCYTCQVIKPEPYLLLRVRPTYLTEKIVKTIVSHNCCGKNNGKIIFFDT